MRASFRHREMGNPLRGDVVDVRQPFRRSRLDALIDDASSDYPLLPVCVDCVVGVEDGTG